jgi:hypothetical protein
VQGPTKYWRQNSTLWAVSRGCALDKGSQILPSSPHWLLAASTGPSLLPLVFTQQHLSAIKDVPTCYEDTNMLIYTPNRLCFLSQTVKYPLTLQCANISILENKLCHWAYPGHISDSMICAGLWEGGRGSCQVRSAWEKVRQAGQFAGSWGRWLEPQTPGPKQGRD